MQLEPVIAWATTKGINLAEGKARGLIRDFLELETLDELIHLEVKHISNQLSAIIKAPYKQALMHLREGNIIECKKKLIEAISLNDLDLPAKLLYIEILRLEKKYDIALEQYWDLLDIFGFHESLVPPFVFDAYVKYFFREVRVSRMAQAILKFDLDCYPREIWCSPKGVAIRWDRWWYPMFPFFARSAVSAFAWKADPERSEWDRAFREKPNALEALFAAGKGSPGISLITGKCVVLHYKKREYCEAFSMCNGSMFPERMSKKEMRASFATESKLIERCHATNKSLDSFNFGGMNFKEGTIETDRRMQAPSQASMQSEWGTIEIDFGFE